MILVKSSSSSSSSSLIRCAQIRLKHSFVLKDTVLNSFEEGLKHRKQPGNRRRFDRNLPYLLQLAATSVINRYRGKNFRRNVQKINDEFLRTFVDRPDGDDSSRKKIKVDESFDFEKFNRNKESIKNQQRDRTLYFQKEFYNDHECAGYMAARLPANYAAISRVFHEIQMEEPEFVPKSVFDFGSGPGTTIWAANEYWPDSIGEYFCVDINENMNQLSRELLQKGVANNDNILDQIFYRQFLPAKHSPPYDLVVSAFSLLEMQDTSSRIYVVENLWRKTNGALVLIEHGSRAGFTALMEARNFLLQISNQSSSSSSTSSDSVDITKQLAKVNGSIMAPCPHDFICPRLTGLAKKSYCNFSVNYQQLDYGQENPGIKSERFTFIVMKKHGHFRWKEEQKNWARAVEPVLKKTGHTICRVCVNDGTLKEIIVSKAKSDRHLYRCAKKCEWGDKIPADVIFEEMKKS